MIWVDAHSTAVARQRDGWGTAGRCTAQCHTLPDSRLSCQFAHLVEGVLLQWSLHKPDMACWLALYTMQRHDTVTWPDTQVMQLRACLRAGYCDQRPLYSPHMACRLVRYACSASSICCILAFRLTSTCAHMCLVLAANHRPLMPAQEHDEHATVATLLCACMEAARLAPTGSA